MSKIPKCGRSNESYYLLSMVLFIMLHKVVVTCECVSEILERNFWNKIDPDVGCWVGALGSVSYSRPHSTVLYNPSLVPSSPTAHLTQLGMKSRDVTELGPWRMPIRVLFPLTKFWRVRWPSGPLGILTVCHLVTSWNLAPSHVSEKSIPGY